MVPKSGARKCISKPGWSPVSANNLGSPSPWNQVQNCQLYSYGSKLDSRQNRKRQRLQRPLVPVQLLRYLPTDRAGTSSLRLGPTLPSVTGIDLVGILCTTVLTTYAHTTLRSPAYNPGSPASHSSNKVHRHPQRLVRGMKTLGASCSVLTKLYSVARKSLAAQKLTRSMGNPTYPGI